MKTINTIFCCALLLVVVGCSSMRRNVVDLTPSLESTKWQAVEINGAEQELEENLFTLNFDADDRLSGRGACNNIMGSYKVEAEGIISFGQLAATRMMCPNIDAESRFISALDKATRYEVSEGKLYLFDKQDTVLAVLVLR